MSRYHFLRSMTTYPLGLPDELMEELKRTAADTHLSMADAMRQAIKFGRPRFERVSPGSLISQRRQRKLGINSDRLRPSFMTSFKRSDLVLVCRRPARRKMVKFSQTDTKAVTCYWFVAGRVTG